MKFNKSAESDFWYVAFDNDFFVGKIHYDKERVWYEPRGDIYLLGNDLNQILSKIKEIEKSLGIDTTSTFTSNSELI